MAIIGRKVGMTQIFDRGGQGRSAVTVMRRDPASSSEKTADKEGYDSVQLGYGEVAPEEADKSQKGPPQRRPASAS